MRKDLWYELYKQCLDDRIEMEHTQVNIRRHGYQVDVYVQGENVALPHG